MIALIQSQEAVKTAKYLQKVIELLEPETIHFFFCSSDDVKDDRKELRYNLSKRNYILGELHLDDWTDLGLINTQNTQQNIQSAFDEKILKSDYVVFIFGDEFGTNTMHEWNICIKNTKRKPIILLGLKKNINKYDLCRSKAFKTWFKKCYCRLRIFKYHRV